VVVTDGQVRKVMKEFAKSGSVSRAALKGDVDRGTARKYLTADKLPSELATPRNWKTRKDPFAEVWEQDIEPIFVDAPEIEAKLVFEFLCELYPDRFEEGQLRTLQRRKKQWLATSGPEREIMFPQEHRPGEAMQTDFTCANELGVTIAGEPFPHLLCNCVLPYSNWQRVTVARSESLLAIKHGVQEAVFHLGKVTAWHQTDNSTAATHSLPEGLRTFNDEYLAFMEHLGMTPRTIRVGASNQNGDVEALNGALKRRLRQHLLLRGSSDFDSVEEYQRFIDGVIGRANGLRIKKLEEELRVMRTLTVDRVPTFRLEDAKVCASSTIRVMRNTYSVPSRLIGETVRSRVYDDRIEVWYAQQHQVTMPRLHGEANALIDYRHVIWSLVRKPGAFQQYKYRESMFPTMTFRRAYDALIDGYPRDKEKADLEYLRILHLAASTMEKEVESALELLLETGSLRNVDDVRELLDPERPVIPALVEQPVDLTVYDRLLSRGSR